MHKSVLIALMVMTSPAAAHPIKEDPTPQASAGPWVDCIRQVGRDHRARRAPVAEYERAIEAECAEAGSLVRVSHPNVFRLSLEEALSTYEYCLPPARDASPRCRNLQS